uniref:RING-type domain-containing protein n=1 Tax=Palpitomonas bilix TaxID=652834 RepID=A0A7S3CZ90_9EUKA|mmetsp:Transcript_15375/g.38870  ORF Transcript_15375/g.38870 Transcript_15375/m.38870 type:complete len:517 (+) Transcript_15375:263-1813(+)
MIPLRFFHSSLGWQLDAFSHVAGLTVFAALVFVRLDFGIAWLMWPWVFAPLILFILKEAYLQVFFPLVNGFVRGRRGQGRSDELTPISTSFVATKHELLYSGTNILFIGSLTYGGWKFLELQSFDNNVTVTVEEGLSSTANMLLPLAVSTAVLLVVDVATAIRHLVVNGMRASLNSFEDEADKRMSFPIAVSSCIFDATVMTTTLMLVVQAQQKLWADNEVILEVPVNSSRVLSYTTALSPTYVAFILLTIIVLGYAFFFKRCFSLRGGTLASISLSGAALVLFSFLMGCAFLSLGQHLDEEYFPSLHEGSDEVPLKSSFILYFIAAGVLMLGIVISRTCTHRLFSNRLLSTQGPAGGSRQVGADSEQGGEGGEDVELGAAGNQRMERQAMEQLDRAVLQFLMGGPHVRRNLGMNRGHGLPDMMDLAILQAIQRGRVVNDEERRREERRRNFSSFPTHAYVEGSLPEEKRSCAICMEDYKDGEMLRTLPCFHVFHQACIDEWANREPSCPICRLSQ